MSLASRFESVRTGDMSQDGELPICISEKSMHYGKYLMPLFANPFTSVRINAFNSAVVIMSEKPEAADQIIPAYVRALIGPDRLVARHALSFLSQVIEACPEHGDMLLRAAIGAGSNKYGADYNKIVPIAARKLQEIKNKNMSSASSTASSSSL